MSATATTPRTITLELMRGNRRRHRKERLVRVLFLSAAALGLVISLAIVLALVERAIRWLFDIDPGWLWAEGWFPRADEFDLLTVLSGTVMIAVIAMAVAAPLGLGAAAYLSEYATPRIRRTLKPILETLASIPSVVLGYFALQWINPELVRRIFGSAGTFNLLAAGLAVGILTIPLVASVAEDALHAVPHALREGAYGIGARRKTVTTRVVFPAAVSGIVASLILGFSRAVGETMIVAIAAGATGGALRTFNPLERGQTMTGAISSLAIGSDQVRGSGFAFDSLYFVGLLLFAITFLLNVVSERFVRRVRSRY
ncbi:MAG TPA: phosphate ABC transporter permease subunit PstC [Actinomycetota bacterium]|nr:phosphate ABC transporter permease subunit PstC [Actinomycetota bacterium]